MRNVNILYRILHLILFHHMSIVAREDCRRVLFRNRYEYFWADLQDKPTEFVWGKQFNLRGCNLAPFVQRCCTIARFLEALPWIPWSCISQQFELKRLRTWIRAVLGRPAVVATVTPAPKLLGRRWSNVVGWEWFAAHETTKLGTFPNISRAMYIFNHMILCTFIPIAPHVCPGK